MSAAQPEAFLVFLGGLAEDFDRLLAAEDEDLRALLGFGRGPLYADADDLAALQAGIAELLAPYQEDRGEGKRRLSLATVLLPEVGP